MTEGSTSTSSSTLPDDFAQDAEERQEAHDQQRRVELDQVRRKGITRALSAYENLGNHDVLSIRIRAGFIRTSDPRRTSEAVEPYTLGSEVRSRPPMTKLVDRRRHSLRLLLTAFFVARLTTEPGKKFVNNRPNTPSSGDASWMTLAGLHLNVPATKTRDRRRKFNTAIDALDRHNLVALVGEAGVAGRYRGFSLLSEDGSGTDYRVPGDELPSREAISVPADFFRQGWHLVLTDQEIVTYLAIIDRTGHLRMATRTDSDRDVGVDLKREVRYGTYGISDEAYSSVHQLHRFGLIELRDPMPNRRNPGRHYPPLPWDENAVVPETAEVPPERLPYRLIYRPDTAAVYQNALERVLDVLAT